MRIHSNVLFLAVAALMLTGAPSFGQFAKEREQTEKLITKWAERIAAEKNPTQALFASIPRELQPQVSIGLLERQVHVGQALGCIGENRWPKRSEICRAMGPRLRLQAARELLSIDESLLNTNPSKSFLNSHRRSNQR